VRLPGPIFDNRFARLPDGFFARVQPAPLPEPYLVAVSAAAADELGVTPAAFEDPALVDALAGNRPIEGAEPLAAVYAGHQFGVWAGRLGDGRALMLGEVVAPDGARWELQLKGAGRTPFSRGADGRAAGGATRAGAGSQPPPMPAAGSARAGHATGRGTTRGRTHRR